MIDLIIHVGIRKSATTWLQNRFFSQLPNINYVGKTEKDYPEWLIDWHYLDDFEFERRTPAIRSSLASQLRGDSINILSSEAFTNTAVIWQQANRIKGIFPEARIIVTLRDPIDVLISHYKLDVAEGRYHLPLDEYLDWGRTPYDLTKRKPIYLPDFFYDEMLDHYYRLFGHDNVCVLRYEDMTDSPHEYFSALQSFIGSTNDSFTYLGLDEKMNVGGTDDLVRQERAANVISLLQAYYPTAAKAIKEEGLLADIDVSIVSEKLRLNLQSYFMGKCHGYY